MASLGPERSGIISGINVTPLVDITLVLLIVFIVTAKIVVSPAVPLDLPASAHTEQMQVVFSIIVEKNGSILVNGERTDPKVLIRQAENAYNENHDIRAVIQADGGAEHRTVMHILNILKNAKIEHIAFGAMPEEGQN